ncbi:hypothetical protein ACROYT_G040227 [Oculina patagonica]
MDELPDSDEDDDDEFAPFERDSKAAASSCASTSTDTSFSSTRCEPSRSLQALEDRDQVDMETEVTKTAAPTLQTDTEEQGKTTTDMEIQAMSCTQASETDTDKDDHRRDRTTCTEDIQEKDALLQVTSQGTEHTDKTGLAGEQVTERQSLEKVEFRLDNYTSAEELESLGLDCLKEELMTRGLKCGGTLQQRAQRLFATKGVPLDQLDPSFFAKPTGNKKFNGKK